MVLLILDGTDTVVLVLWFWHCGTCTVVGTSTVVLALVPDGATDTPEVTIALHRLRGASKF